MRKHFIFLNRTHHTASYYSKQELIQMPLSYDWGQKPHLDHSSELYRQTTPEVLTHPPHKQYSPCGQSNSYLLY